MKTMKMLLTAVTIMSFGYCLHADELTNLSTNPIVRFGEYSAIRETNGNYRLINPSEFWRGAWQEDTNGWRVQLRVFARTNSWLVNKGIINPVLRVEWGSVVKNSGGGYLLAPNGKFAKFELLGPNGTAIHSKPNAGKDLLRWHYDDLHYGTNLPAWMDLSGGSLVANFPETISTNVYPQIAGRSILLYTWASSNEPPSSLGGMRFDDLYSITNEGDYTLTVQPILYKQYNHADDGILDRVDLPSVTTKVHLVPNIKQKP